MNIEEKSTFNFPTVIRFGVGVIKELGPHLKEQGLSRPLIVTDPGLAKLPLIESLLSDLKEQSLTPSVFSSIQKNPVKSDVEKGDEAYKEATCDCIIGIGGGASMDVARAIALKVNHSRDLFDYEELVGGDQLITEDIPYFVTVPTTSGTGSEVGRSAVISDDETHQKKILFHPSLLAQRVFADPELTMKLPAHITAATGIDALTHNIEAYLANGFSPMCDGIALEGIKLIHESLLTAVKNPDLESRSKMMAGALMGAVAFQKGLGLIHSMAHALSTHKDLHHGLANALMIVEGIRFNRATVNDRIVAIEKHLEITDSLENYLERLMSDIQIPKGLKGQGVTLEDVPALSKLAMADGCHLCNVAKLTENDFQEMYKRVINV